MEPVGDVAGAFLLGVLSAASLGVGALTARFWKPTNFMLGLLTAFGAGALLSAVTIDIVAHEVEAGRFGWLAVGAAAGGIVFEVLNRAVNARGGFLRKTSTSITFLRDREQRRRRRILDGLERIEIFDGLPERELDAIAKAFRSQRLDAGDILYHRGDPCDHLNVLVGGEIVLRTADGVVQLHPHQGFGHLAFVTGTQHHSTATASTTADVLRLSRNRLRSVVQSCPTLAGRLDARIHHDELLVYLHAHHPEVTENEIEAWRERVDREGVTRLPVLIDTAEATPPENVVDHLADVGPFRELRADGLERIADLMFPEEHESGYVFFRPGEPSDRIYVIADGDVALIDATGESSSPMLLQEGEEFGTLSCLTGTHHTASAIAQSACDVWVLRRADLAALVEQEPSVQRTVARFLGSERVHDYLVRDQGIDAKDVESIVQRSRTGVAGGHLPAGVVVNAGAAAPIAIWLGLMLDGVPESLVIGATAGAVRVSFIVGLVLSNYPESLASSVGMREQGLGWRAISMLWASVILVTGIGAAIGSFVFQQAPDEAFAVVEGLAAGAMLTVITQTMMPEALHRSGSYVGLAALSGFLFTTLIGA